MSLFCIKVFGILINLINFLLDPTKKVSFDAVLDTKVETPVLPFKNAEYSQSEQISGGAVAKK